MFQSCIMLYIENRKHLITLILFHDDFLFLSIFTHSGVNESARWFSITSTIFYTLCMDNGIYYILTQSIAFIYQGFLRLKETWTESGKVQTRHIYMYIIHVYKILHIVCSHKVLSQRIFNWTHLLILIHLSVENSEYIFCCWHDNTTGHITMDNFHINRFAKF